MFPHRVILLEPVTRLSRLAGSIIPPKLTNLPYSPSSIRTATLKIADHKSGWNTEVKGWGQYDHTIYPGAVAGPLCVDGGLQTSMPIKILFHEGNCWVYVIDRWIGYYPASLFSADIADPAQTLAQGSDQVNCYGDVYQTDETLTTTDMGIREWP